MLRLGFILRLFQLFWNNVLLSSRDAACISLFFFAKLVSIKISKRCTWTQRRLFKAFYHIENLLKTCLVKKKVILIYNFCQNSDLTITRTDAAFGGWCEACGAKLASLAIEGALPPFWPPTALAERIFGFRFFFCRKFFSRGPPRRPNRGRSPLKSERSELSAAGLAPAAEGGVSASQC